MVADVPGDPDIPGEAHRTPCPVPALETPEEAGRFRKREGVEQLRAEKSRSALSTDQREESEGKSLNFPDIVAQSVR